MNNENRWQVKRQSLLPCPFLILFPFSLKGKFKTHTHRVIKGGHYIQSQIFPHVLMEVRGGNGEVCTLPVRPRPRQRAVEEGGSEVTGPQLCVSKDPF